MGLASVLLFIKVPMGICVEHCPEIKNLARFKRTSETFDVGEKNRDVFVTV